MEELSLLMATKIPSGGLGGREYRRAARWPGRLSWTTGTRNSSQLQGRVTQRLRLQMFSDDGLVTTTVKAPQTWI